MAKIVGPVAGGVALILWACYMSWAAKEFQKERADYKSESACVAAHIALGVERRDIATGGGTCWLLVGTEL